MTYLTDADREALGERVCFNCNDRDVWSLVETMLARVAAETRESVLDEAAEALFAEAERMDASPYYSIEQANGMETAGHFVRDLRGGGERG